MDFDDERKILEADFVSKWNNATEIQFANGPAVQTPNTPWVRLNILRAKTQFGDVGSGMTRTVGTLAVQIFTPGDSGSTLAWQYADIVAILYNRQSLQTANGYIHFEACDPEEYGHNSGWYQVNANVPYRRDALKQLIDGGGFNPFVPIIGIDGGTF